MSVPPSSSLDHPKQSRIAIPGIVLVGYSEPPPEFRSAPASIPELTWRHASWAAKRQKTWDAMLRLHKSDRVLSRFANCGAMVHVKVRDDGQGFKVCSDTCKNRNCVVCGAERAATISENLIQHIEAKDCRFMTLTLRHSRSALTDQIDRLYDSFAKLRRRDFFKSCVKGGAAFLEVKLSDRTGLWHVHLHCLVEGSFVDQRKLSSEWLAVTGDSSIVDIRAIPDCGHVARYITKYVTKPIDSYVYSDTAKLDEAMAAFGGRRLCLTFGSWRGFNLTDVPGDGHEWKLYAYPATLLRQLRDGVPGAAQAIQILLKALPGLEGYFDTALRCGP